MCYVGSEFYAFIEHEQGRAPAKSLWPKVLCIASVTVDFTFFPSQEVDTRILPHLAHQKTVMCLSFPVPIAFSEAYIKFPYLKHFSSSPIYEHLDKRINCSPLFDFCSGPVLTSI